MNKKLKNLHYCYNCGDDLNCVPNNEEHIPARNLFVDSKTHGEIIKVPSCVKCNTEFSATDDDLRDVIGWLNESITDSKRITGKTIRSLFVHEKDGYGRLSGNIEKPSLEFNVGNLYKSHQKNFKGLFVWENIQPIDKKYQIRIIDKHCDAKEFEMLQPTLDMVFYNQAWKPSGAKEIFRYRLVGLNENWEPTTNSAKPIYWVAELLYHEKVHAVVFAKYQY